MSRRGGVGSGIVGVLAVAGVVAVATLQPAPASAVQPPPPPAPAVTLQVSVSAMEATATATATQTVSSWAVSWGDGAASSGPPPWSHTYANPGTYTLSVTAADAGGSGSAQESVTIAAPPAPAPHVFLLMMENKSAPQVVGNSYVQSLMAAGGAATNYSAVGSWSAASLPNYLALTAGSNAFDVASAQNPGQAGDYPSDAPFAIPNLFAQLEAAGISWGAYADGYPGSMPSDLSTIDYATLEGNGYGFAGHHFPALFYTDIVDSPAAASHLGSWTDLQTLLAGPASGVPQFVWVTPTVGNADAVAGMQGYVQAIQASAAYKAGGVLIVTWDNQPTSYGTLTGFTQAPDTNSNGGNVLTLVLGPGVTPGTVWRQQLSHYSTLAAIESGLGLPLLGNAATAPAWSALASLVQGTASAVAEQMWASGQNPTITSRNITLHAAGSGQVAIAWLDSGDFYVEAGAGVSSVTLTGIGSGPFRWGGQAQGAYDASTGAASWTITQSDPAWADIVH